MRRRALTGFAVAAVALTVAACSAEVEEDDDALAADVVASEPSEPTEPPQAAPATGSTRPRLHSARVGRVIDGDTLETADGRRIRLVQIDAPEGSGECYGAEATAELEALLPRGSRIGLARDANLDDVDRYGRLLRYVFKGSRNVNVVLVRRGAASVWFFDGDRGRYADRLLAAARAAETAKRGAWGACRAQLDPTAGFATTPKAVMQPAAGPGCMSGYSPCLPVTGDLDCAEVRSLGKAPVVVSGDDPYRLDGDDDGHGCE